ncbi:DUF6428 family protein [Lutimonas halocynthiae]|uniref:DUF6428 family protein n=1 Tax=Lutimonas halocynthiae TaxID=1446477 RepID=UPI0025B2CC34|nr:DUF6428 family protein [Lutimonas halocynthiae]MDN3641177.1 DUF6428 family protein [Lutimonas halocynthiae]
MKVSEFIKVLEEQKNKELLFSYTKDKLVGANYHLTEVKNVQFDTTDCGGKTNFWEETHFQLWESPTELGKRDYMTTDKILAIINRVDSIKAIKKDTDLKMEYGNDTFATAVMPVKHIEFDEKRVYINLFSEATRCKANDVCGISGVEIDTESPIFDQQKPKAKLSELQEASSCNPNSGCC